MTNPQAPIDSDLKLLSAMRQGVDYTETIRCRGQVLRIRPLSIVETMQVAHEVQSQMSGKDEFSQNALSENVILAKETLRRATTSDVGKTDTPLTDYIMERMTPEELQYLMKQYVAALDKKNPSLELMKPEEVEALVQALKKSPESDLALELTALSFSQLVSLSHTLIKSA